ncbi:DNA polymerase domain-containing protein [Haloplanus salinus]|nr:DNA polymerase domain-containing protein [Haloplanus salinus]
MKAHTVEVMGFNPYFYVPTAEVKALVDFERREHVVSVKHGYTSLFGDDVSRIEVTTTNATRELRELFSENFETDVWYENRALIDLELYTGIRVPDGATTIKASDVEPIDFTTEFSVLTFDIETDDRGRFPKPGERAVLSLVSHDSQSGEYRGFVWLNGRPVGETLPDGLPEGLDALDYYETEVEMLAGFAQYVSGVNPDVLTAWNIGFDAPYILERMKKLSVDASRLARDGWAGMSKTGRPHIAGRVIYDMLDAYKSTKRGELPSYSLNAVAAEELGEQKLDHAGEGIYEMWESNLDKLLRYNFHDVRLVVGLNDTLGIIAFRAALANAVGADFGDAENNNDFIEMMVRRKLHERGLVGPTTVYEKKEDQFKGGYVRDPYYGVAEHVVGMDLESLYPNTMWMLNASPECRVDPETFKGPFTQAPNGAAFRLDKIGVMTELVDEALSLKGEAKKKRNSAAPDTAEYARFSEEYDVRKTIVNSLFGVTGWEYFFLYDELTAESISTMGQEVIKFTSRYVEANSTGRVIYGDTDSVPMDEPTLIRDENGEIDIVEIQELEGREGYVDVWTERGFTRVKRVIRKPNRKNLYTIRTKNGVVHATEDHSLVRNDGSEVEPCELEIGDKLLHKDVSKAFEGVRSSISLDRAWLYGFFCGDGSAGEYAYEHPKNSDWNTRKLSWTLNNTSHELLERAAVSLKNEFGVNSEISETMESSGTYKLQPSNNGKRGKGASGAVSDLSTHFSDMCYTPSRQKRVPRKILNADTQAVQAFLDGYMAADGHVGERYTKRFHEAETKHLPLATGLVYLLQRVGYTFNINFRTVARDGVETEYYKLRCQTSHRGTPLKVEKIEPYQYDGDYVYDLETENHHFHAGAGNIIVHNSNYVMFPDASNRVDALEEAYRLADELNETAYAGLSVDYNMGTRDCRWRIEVESYSPRFFQYGKKKRYALHVTWKNGKTTDEIKKVGLHTNRSDVAPFTSELQTEVVEAILRDGGDEAVSTLIYDAAQALSSDDPDWNAIGIPQGIKKPLAAYHRPTAQVVGAINSNKLLGTNFGENSKPKRVYLQPTYFAELDDSVEVLCFDDPEILPDGLRLDTSRMVNTLIVKPIAPLVEAVGVDIEAALLNQYQTGLGSFL